MIAHGFLRMLSRLTVFARTFQDYRTYRIRSRSISTVRNLFCNYLQSLCSSIPTPLYSSRQASFQPSETGDHAAQISKHHPAHKAPESLGLAREILPGLAMACSLWDSLQGSRGTPQRFHPTLRTSFLTPLRAGPTATGKLHCSISNFPRLAQVSWGCKPQAT